MNGYQKGDWKVTSQIYGPNCSIIPPNQPTVKGREGKAVPMQNIYVRCVSQRTAA